MAASHPSRVHLQGPLHVYINRLKRLLFGAPKRTDQAHQERLGVFTGLAVFSADALSSVAYATEEIILVLLAAGTAATAYSLPVGLAIVLLVLIVAASYSQTIKAYPSGGGSYIVSKDNLGTGAGLTAGAALLTDYVMTVAVSTASGIAAITSAIPSLQGHEVALCLIALWFIAWMNLRGTKESGVLFAVPTYGFIIAMFVLIGVGAYKAVTGGWHPAVSPAAPFGLGVSAHDFQQFTQSVTMFMILKAFSSGCTALSGIEAVSNGIQAFKAPESENAAKTMSYSRTILYTMFGGITLLAFGFRALPQIDPNTHEVTQTLLSVLGHEVFGTGVLYYIAQVTTMLILLLAANTAYADFPRLAGMMARDGFLPRKLANRGDTLVFNAGVYVLALLASFLIILFKGEVHLLIPLYAVGVFLAFTMSQTGMVRHWFKVAKKNGEKLSKHAWSIFINGLGAVLSAVALVVQAVSKFMDGAWIIVIVVPIMIAYFLHVSHYYERFKGRVEALLDEHLSIDDAKNIKVVVTIGGLTPVIDHVMRVARRISPDITALYVATDPELGEKIARKWDIKRHHGTKLTVLPSPYRTVVPPIRKYLTDLHKANPNTLINLLVPVIVTNDPLDTYLHNGTADLMLRELRYSEGILMTVIPFYVSMNPSDQHVIAEYPNVGDD